MGSSQFCNFKFILLFQLPNFMVGAVATSRIQNFITAAATRTSKPIQEILEHTTAHLDFFTDKEMLKMFVHLAFFFLKKKIKKTSNRIISIIWNALGR